MCFLSCIIYRNTVCLDFKSVSAGWEKFCILCRRLLIVGKECKCKLLYEHENIEELGSNIPKYIKKKMQWTNVIPATQYTSALYLNNTLVYFAAPKDFCQRVILLCLCLNK